MTFNTATSINLKTVPKNVEIKNGFQKEGHQDVVKYLYDKYGCILIRNDSYYFHEGNI